MSPQFVSAESYAAILDLVTYKDWRWIVSPVSERSNRMYLQVEFDAPDNITGEPTIQRGRKFLLSPYMTKSEVVQTAFKAVMTAEEHEIREQFEYRGRDIFGPHLDVDALWDMNGEVDVRVDPRTVMAS